MRLKGNLTFICAWLTGLSMDRVAALWEPINMPLGCHCSLIRTYYIGLQKIAITDAAQKRLGAGESPQAMHGVEGC